MTLRRLVNMAEGAIDREIDALIAHQDDAWERTSMLAAMLYNTRAFASDSKEPDDFNFLKKWLKEEPNTAKAESEYDDLSWVK